MDTQSFFAAILLIPLALMVRDVSTKWGLYHTNAEEKAPIADTISTSVLFGVISALLLL